MSSNNLDEMDLDNLNYVHKYPYNGTGAAGGDALTDNLNIWYEVCAGPSLSAWSLRSSQLTHLALDR